MDLAKRAAATRAVDEHVQSGQLVGIGSGSTIVFAVERLAARIAAGELHDVVCVPTSFQAEQLLIMHKLPYKSMSSVASLNVAIDGADEVDANLDCIKGGGGCHVQEKIVASSAEKFILIADETKDATFLGTVWTKGVPIEVLPLAATSVRAKLQQGVFEGSVCNLRMAVAKAGPVVTDNGNFILDVYFGALDGQKWTPRSLEQALRMVSGIVDVGLFVNMASEVYFGRRSGEVQHKTRRA